MTQSFFNAQYQGAARTQGFQPEQVPDISQQLRQNLNTEQQAFNNLANALAREPKQEPLTALAGFSETLANTLVTYAKKEGERQKAEGIALYYEDRAAQDAALTEQQTNVEQLKAVDTEFKSAAANALVQGAPFEVADRLKGLSGWKKYGYAQSVALAAGRGYKSWMMEQLQANKEKLVVNQGTPEEREISINDQNLNVSESAAVRAHLRTKYLQESGLANLSRGLQAEAFKPMHEADAELHGLARKNYAINKSREDEQSYLGTFNENGDFSQLITSLSTLVDENGKPYGREGAWKRATQYLVDSALNGEDIDFKALYDQKVSWDPKGRTYGELYGKSGQRLKVVETEIAKAKIALYKQEEAQKQIEEKEYYDAVMQDLRGREGGFTAEDAEFFQKEGLRKGYRRSSELDQLANNLSLDAEQKQSLDKQAEQLYKVGMLNADFVSQLPPDLYRKWAGLAEIQEKAMEIPESKTHLDGLANHVKAVTGASSVKNLGGVDTLVIGELQRKYKQKVAQIVSSGQVEDPVAVHNAAYAEVLNEFNVGFKTKGNRYFYQNGFPNYLPQTGGARNAQQSRMWLLDRYQTIKSVGLQSALASPQFLMSDARMDQVVRDYGKPTFTFPQEVMHFAQQYNMSPLDILNKQLKASGKGELPPPSSLGRLKGNPGANEAFLNRYNTELRSARYAGQSSVWREPTSFRPGVSDLSGQGLQGVLGMIRSGEGGYTSMFPGESYPQLTNMTIAEVVEFQKQKLRDGRKSAAVGGYQFRTPELAAKLAGLPMNAKFNPANQDKMAIAYMVEGTKRSKLAAYIKGQSDDINAAHTDIANEWAALAGPSGRGMYDYDGTNKASIKADTVRRALMEARRAYLAGQRG
jgi:muramidase (phage lysozyme)